MTHPLNSDDFVNKFNQLALAVDPASDSSPNTSVDRGPLSPSFASTAPSSTTSKDYSDSLLSSSSPSPQPSPPSINNTPIQSSSSTPTHMRGVPDYRKLFVSNLSFVTTPDDLESIFRVHGPCEIRLQSDPLTGRSLGYAFVSFESSEAAASAKISASGMIFQGRALRIEYAVQKFHKPQSFFHAGIKKFERSGRLHSLSNSSPSAPNTSRVPSLPLSGMVVPSTSRLPPTSARSLSQTSPSLLTPNIAPNSIAAASAAAAAAAGMPFITYANPSNMPVALPVSLPQSSNNSSTIAAAVAAANAGRDPDVYNAYAAAAAAAAAANPPNLFTNYVNPPSSNNIRHRHQHSQAQAAAQMAAAAAAYNYNYQLNAAANFAALANNPPTMAYIATPHRHTSSIGRSPVSGSEGNESLFNIYGQSI